MAQLRYPYTLGAMLRRFPAKYYFEKNWVYKVMWRLIFRLEVTFWANAQVGMNMIGFGWSKRSCLNEYLIVLSSGRIQLPVNQVFR